MKSRSRGYDYGKCDACGAALHEKRIQQDFWVRGKLVVVRNVPAGVCPRCGEKVVKADVGQRLAKIIGNAKQLAKAPKISVPTVEYNAEEAVL